MLKMHRCVKWDASLINPNISPADPNAHILWIESVNSKLKALRDIEAGDSPSII